MTDRLVHVEMIEKRQAIVYWLLPDPPAREVFSKKIRELATRFGAPEFEPHVTVFISPDSSRQPSDVLGELEPKTIELTASNISFSEKFTKTLFLQFEKSQALQKLGDEIWRVSGAPERHIIDPHLSLLYAKLALEKKKALANEIKFSFGKVVFRSICAMGCAWPTTTAAEVKNWRLLAPTANL